MAYSKVNNGDKAVTYLDRNYSQLKQQLIDFAKIYYPDTANDFSEGSPGMMFLEMASYVGDVLSFYTDTQVQETMLEYAQERDNLFALAYNLGYRPNVTNASSVKLDITQTIPAGADGPDFRYAFTLKKGSVFIPSNNSNVEFLTQEDVDFNFSSSFDPTEVTIFSINTTTNQPTKYLLKKSVSAISAKKKTRTFNVGAPERFLKLELNDSDIIGIESVVDEDNNEYTEVPYLAQETIFEEVKNTEANDPTLSQYNGQTPYLLKLKKVPKRFATRFKANNNLEIHFGSGISDSADEEIIPNPDNVGLGINDGRSMLDFAFDPSNFLYTKAYGEVPRNTTLTVTYLQGGGVVANAPANIVTRKGTLITQANTAGVSITDQIASLSVTNPQPAIGGGPGDTNDDIRLNAAANFNSQQRTVTKDDYIFRSLVMPPKFGKVAKAFITQDDQISVETSRRISNPNGLNLHVLGYDINKNLVNLNIAAKENLATYLGEYRMLTDAINIKDAYVVNLGLDFEITTFKNYNNDEVITSCINKLKEYFNVDRWQVNQPIIISEVSNTLAQIRGVQTVESVKFNNKFGEVINYSKYKYDLDQATVNGIIYPSVDPMIFEIKFPNTDIKGRVKTY
jgi:hypothetical protein